MELHTEKRSSICCHTNPSLPNRERKEDTEKRKLILLMASAVGGDVHIVNPEREFEFTQAGRKFRVVLSCPRS